MYTPRLYGVYAHPEPRALGGLVQARRAAERLASELSASEREAQELSAYKDRGDIEVSRLRGQLEVLETERAFLQTQYAAAQSKAHESQDAAGQASRERNHLLVRYGDCGEQPPPPPRHGQGRARGGGRGLRRARARLGNGGRWLFSRRCGSCVRTMVGLSAPNLQGRPRAI